MRFLFALVLLLSGYAHADEELLDPEKAFRYSAKLLEPGKLEARFQIADGYYLYRDKIRFSADAGIKLGAPALPAGKIKQDENFGKVETYRGDIRVRIPFTYADGAAKTFKLNAAFQGCADLGVCYTPQDGVATIAAASSAAATPAATPAAAPAALQQQNPEILERLKSLAGNLAGAAEEPEFLPPEEAFKLALTPRADGHLDARFTIAKDYYLYRDKITFKIVEPAGVSVTGIDLPAAEEKHDDNFGKMFVYHQSFNAVVRLAGVPAGSQKPEAGIIASRL